MSHRESNPHQDEASCLYLNLPHTTNIGAHQKAKLDIGPHSTLLMRIHQQMYPHYLDNRGNLKPNSL